MKTKESLESMETEFTLIEMSSSFFKIHHFYGESVFPIFKMKVQSQVPINKDKKVL